MKQANFIILNDDEKVYLNNLSKIISIKKITYKNAIDIKNEIFFIVGRNIEDKVGKKIINLISKNPNIIIIIPPFNRKQYVLEIGNRIVCEIYKVEFGKTKIIDYSLFESKTLTAPRIFYKEAIKSNLGNPMIISEKRENLLIKIQDLKIPSTILITTLFIGPSAIRTNYTDLKLFLNSMLDKAMSNLSQKQKRKDYFIPKMYNESIYSTNFKLFILYLKKFLNSKEVYKKEMREFFRKSYGLEFLNEIIEEAKDKNIILEKDDSIIINDEIYMSYIEKFNLNSYFRRIK